MGYLKSEKLNTIAKEVARPVDSILSINQTVDEAIQHIRKNHSLEKSALYFYVIDARNKLLGIVNTRDLLIASPETPISTITNTKIKTLQSQHTLYEGLLLMQKFHLLALPVIEHGVFLGIIDIQTYFDETTELNSTKKRQEIFQTLGFILEEGVKQSLWTKYRTRMPWILCNMLGGIVCALISDYYQIVFVKVVVLAMFIPLVLSLSESISMQAMTQSLYQIGKYQIFWKESIRYIYHESKLFALIALTSGGIVGLLSLLWGSTWGAGPVIAATIMSSIILTAIVSAFIPLLLHSWKLDPQVASGPIVLMLADVITTLIYLTIAFVFLVNF